MECLQNSVKSKMPQQESTKKKLVKVIPNSKMFRNVFSFESNSFQKIWIQQKLEKITKLRYVWLPYIKRFMEYIAKFYFYT